MNSIEDHSLEDQRQQLRQQLSAQRGVIVQQMESTFDPQDKYPRSHTMRFLTRKPALAKKILTGLFTFLVLKKRK